MKLNFLASATSGLIMAGDITPSNRAFEEENLENEIPERPPLVDAGML